MILTTILILSALVAVNFLLLFFSCNKTTKKSDNRLPRAMKAIKTEKSPKVIANQSKSRQLAPTGS